MPKERKPNLYIIAGPNGAGKTTFANRFLPDFVGCKNFVNADLIAAGLSPYAPELATVEAGRLMLKRMDELAQQKADFGFETTLATRTLASRIKAFKQRGYMARLIYLYIESPEIAIARIAERVRKGGHHVPDETVLRRYYAGLRNLFSLYHSLCDSWSLFDNTGQEPVLVASGENSGILLENKELFEHIRSKTRHEET